MAKRMPPEVLEYLKTMGKAYGQLGGAFAQLYEVLGVEQQEYAAKSYALDIPKIALDTIKHHLTRMFDKVGAANRLELALAATRNGLVN